MSKYTKPHKGQKLFYKIWLTIPILSSFVYIFIRFINDAPMRIIVNSYIFSLLFLLLGIYVSVFLYKIFHNLTVIIINIFIPVFFIYVSNLKYNGGINHCYDNLFFISSSTVIIQGLIFAASFFSFRSCKNQINK